MRKPYRVDIVKIPDGMIFNILREESPISTTGVAWTESGSEKVWPVLEDLYLTLSDKTAAQMLARAMPERPSSMPWAGTIWFAAWFAQSIEDAEWVTAFQQVLAMACVTG
jgi:hypothetical protein